jgi:sugar (pentulose or hexulose) kinase
MLAFDLGASNGRAILGEYDGERLTVELKARFLNGPLNELGHWYWNIPRLWADIKASLARVSGEYGTPESIGIDSWGVDFGLLDSSGRLLGNPFHYRDARTDGMREVAFSKLPRELLYKYTGNSFERYNTLFQVMAALQNEGSGEGEASRLLLISDLFAFFLTGATATEFTAATTTQLLRVGTLEWCSPVLEALKIPPSLFTPVTLPGSIRGLVSDRIATETGMKPIPVVAVAQHDTASAVAAIPSLGSDYCFISSGTWSLMGIEVDVPILSNQAMELGYTNEGCANGRYRLLKNIMGLWILQECRRVWEAEGQSFSYGELDELASREVPFASFIDPGRDLFFEPGDMCDRIRVSCKDSGQPVPESRGAIVRCILESLALKYRWALENLETVSGKTIRTIHIVGGGTRNRLLNQFTANSTNRPVLAGPEEAAAIGNLIMQAIGLGRLKNIEDGKRLVRNSIQVEEFVPENVDEWDSAYERFCRICKHAERRKD